MDNWLQKFLYMIIPTIFFCQVAAHVTKILFFLYLVITIFFQTSIRHLPAALSHTIGWVKSRNKSLTPQTTPRIPQEIFGLIYPSFFQISYTAGCFLTSSKFHWTQHWLQHYASETTMGYSTISITHGGCSNFSPGLTHPNTHLKITC